MNTHTLNLNDFLRKYKEASGKDEEAAIIFDLIQEVKNQNKEELLKEIKLDDLATKQDLQIELAKLELNLNGKINIAKWQVIGSVAVMLFIEIALKHLGI